MTPHRIFVCCMVAALAACQRAPTVGPSAVAGATQATHATTPAMQSTPAATASHWRCGEVLVDAVALGGSLQLQFSGRSLVLPHVESLTRARYVDAAGNEFMRQGDGAILVLAGDDPAGDGQRDCTRSNRASPWSEAAARGIVYRAVGSEPGWLVEVGSGDSPPLHAVLDYGERSVDVARSTGISSTPGFGGRTADGVDVVLHTRREPCRDGMSGEAFASSAELTVGGDTYRGCGAYLGE